MRQFKMKNAYGVEYNLMSQNSFLHAPEGLGWGTEPTVERIGESYIVTDSQEVQPATSGEIVFSDYKEYQNFLDFAQVGGLVLCYKPLDKWLNLKCEIYIDKSEIKRESKRLICPVEFLGLSYWYEELEYQTPTHTGGTGKTYPYKYPYTYGSSENSVFNLKLSLPSYFKLEIMGECKNPEWRCIQNDKIVAKGIINAHISSTHKMVVNTDPAHMEIAEYTKNNEFVQSLYGMSDFTTQRIFTLPKGECTFIVLAQGIQAPKAFLEVYKHV